MVSSMREMSEVREPSSSTHLRTAVSTRHHVIGLHHTGCQYILCVCVQLPIARVRFVAVSATIPNIQVSSPAVLHDRSQTTDAAA